MNQDSAGKSPITHVAGSKRNDAVDLRKILQLMFSNWYYFVAALMISGTLAFLYNRYTLPIFNVTSLVLIEEGGTNNISETDRLLQGFGLRPGAQNLDNQILILKSWTIISETVEKLYFDIDYYKKGLMRSASYYPIRPILVIPDQKGKKPYNIEFTLKPVSNTRFSITASANDLFILDTIATFGENITFPGGSFKIYAYPEYSTLLKNNKKLFFVIHDQENLTAEYQRRLKVETASREGTILRLSLEGTNKEKDIDFLNMLVKVFMEINLQKKNQEATRIIDFIDKQLVGVSDSLMIAENRLQDFRSKNRIMDISAQGQQIIEQAVALEDEKARLILESNYFDYLTRYLSKENSQEVPIAPATMGLNDPLLARLMEELSILQSEYFSGGVGEKNPLQGQLQLKILNTKQSLRETLMGIIEANKMAMDENSQQIKRLNSQAAGLPVTERQLLGIERQFQLNNVLYTYLLQQHAEAQIQKASNTPDNELVDPARADRNPVSPNKPMIYLFSILLGLGVPIVILLITNVLNQKITSEEDLKLFTNLPIAGHIPHSKLNFQTVVLSDAQSPVAEAFRSLRTRMQYFTKEVKCPVIMISSSIPGEGKTFAAINLASAYSLSGKKTVILGFDLRRPKLSPDFGITNEKGLSTYLIGKNSIQEIIHSSNFANLDIVPSGPIPPNPSELTDSEKTRELFKYLRDHYDFIIVDTPPVGTVSDGFTIAAIADANIIMVRHGKTMKKPLETTLMDAKDNGIGGLCLLINDYKSNKGSYRYAYRHKYGYTNSKNGA